MNRMITLLVNLVVMLFLSGCAESPSVHYYLLEATTPRSVNISGKTEVTSTAGIGPITIPSLLDRPRIVTRTVDNQVKIDEFNHWAMPLQDNISEVMVSNLDRLEPNRIFRAYPWSLYGIVDIQIVVDIQRFDATPGKSVNLEANWAIKNEKTGVLLKNGRSILQHPLSRSDYASITNGLSQVLGLFSQELRAAIPNSLPPL